MVVCDNRVRFKEPVSWQSRWLHWRSASSSGRHKWRALSHTWIAFRYLS